MSDWVDSPIWEGQSLWRNSGEDDWVFLGELLSGFETDE